MKNKILTLSFVLFASFAFAQATNAPKNDNAKPKAVNKPAPQKVTPPAEKVALLCKAWKFQGVEEFAVVGEPTETQKGDMIQFNADNTYVFIKEGVSVNGKWQMDGAGKYINLDKMPPSMPGRPRLAIKKLESSELIYEHQDTTLIRTLYHYQAK